MSAIPPRAEAVLVPLCFCSHWKLFAFSSSQVSVSAPANLLPVFVHLQVRCWSTALWESAAQPRWCWPTWWSDRTWRWWKLSRQWRITEASSPTVASYASSTAWTASSEKAVRLHRRAQKTQGHTTSCTRTNCVRWLSNLDQVFLAHEQP